jgi:spectrin beta
MLSAEADILRTVDAVEVAQKKLVDIEGDLKAIEPKLVKLKEQATKLTVQSGDELAEKIVFIEKEWTSVDELLRMRKKKLDYDMDYQKFMVEYRALKAWILDISSRIQQQPEPTSLSEAEAGINLHQERKTEIEGKNHRFLSLQNMSRNINEKSKHQSNSYTNEFNAEIQKEIMKLVKDMIESQQILKQACSEKQIKLQECAEYQEYILLWKQLEAWSKQIEQSLNCTDVGDSVLAVKSLLTKHENIESSINSYLAPKSGTFDSLEQRGLEMIKKKFAQSDSIDKIIIELRLTRKGLNQSRFGLVKRRFLIEVMQLKLNFSKQFVDDSRQCWPIGSTAYFSYITNYNGAN